MNLRYILLFAISTLFIITSQSASAVNFITWTYDGVDIENLPLPLNTGYIPYDNPVSIRVDATDENDFTVNGVIDTINVIVTTIDEPNPISYTLTETGPNDGIFKGTNFVFIKDNYRFQETDIVNIVYTMEKEESDCDTDNTITELDSRIVENYVGIKIYSDSDLVGVGLLLIETGENTCTFEGKVQLTHGNSNEITGTLHVSLGDTITFEDRFKGVFYNARIIPELPGKGSIIAHFAETQDDGIPEVTATYNGLSAVLDLAPDGTPGTGCGCPVQPGLVLNFIRLLLGGGGDKSTPPTLGLDQSQKRIVDGGFSFNGNSVDVEQYYTPFPLITTEIGKINTVKLKIYENNGLTNIAHVGLSYGLGKGETFTEGRATIEYDRTFDGVESVTSFDPKHVLGSVNVTTVEINCSVYNNAKCLEVTFDHIFRAPLEFNMVATNIWDFQRNSWQNYFNHGILITGDSMNPPEKHSGIYKGHIYPLTKTDKNTAIDEEGNIWTFDKTWNRNFIKSVPADIDILNSDKISAITKLGFSYSDGQKIFGFERVDHRFDDIKYQQQVQAQNIMKNICKKCQNESFDNIDKIFSYDMPNRNSKFKPETISQIRLENERAQEFLKKYLE